LVNFEKDLKGDDEGAATAKRNIALARSMFENGNNHEELLKATKELYELRVSKLGEGN
jgi:hypothetical protein